MITMTELWPVSSYEIVNTLKYSVIHKASFCTGNDAWRQRQYEISNFWHKVALVSAKTTEVSYLSSWGGFAPTRRSTEVTDSTICHQICDYCLTRRTLFKIYHTMVKLSFPFWSFLTKYKIINMSWIKGNSKQRTCLLTYYLKPF